MPTLVRLGVCTITLYAADHPPPHFMCGLETGARHSS